MARLPKVPDGWLDADSAGPAAGDFQSEDNGSGGVASGSGSSIGPIQGYPETGRDVWRAGNDGAILSVTGKYNSENGYRPDDARYVSPQMMKSWMMQESGGTRQAFETDPFQVNVPGDWVPDKANRAGLTRSQAMTPHTSADAALKWLQYKGSVHDASGAVTSYRGNRAALMGYNGRNDLVGGIPFKQHYADAILNRAQDSYGDNGP
jgi:hypothetical protein